MTSRVGYVFFLTAILGGLLYLLILHPVTLPQDARAIIETVIGGLGAVLMHVIGSVFPSHSPTQPAEPAKV